TSLCSIPKGFDLQECIILKVSGFIQYDQWPVNCFDEVGQIFLHLCKFTGGIGAKLCSQCPDHLSFGLIEATINIKDIFVFSGEYLSCICFAKVSHVYKYSTG